MKKLTVLLLLFTFLLGCLAACNESVSDSSIADESSKIAIFDVESSAIETAESSEITEESSEAPTIDMGKVLYNPGTDIGGRIWSGVPFWPYPNRHMGIHEYLEENEIPDDAYLCVYLYYAIDYPESPDYQGEVFENMRQELMKRGYIEDEELTYTYAYLETKGNEEYIEDVIETGIHTVGYIPISLMRELMEMEYPILYVWLGEDCLEGCQDCNSPYVKNDISE